MANQWLAFMNGVIAGPYSTKQIVRMYAEGVIHFGIHVFPSGNACQISAF